MANLTIYRGVGQTEVTTVSIDEKTIYAHKVMEVETIEAHFTAPAAVPIQIGDYIMFDGKKFSLNLVPSIDKKNIKTNIYKAYFHGILYDLSNKLFISSDGLSEFAEVGNVALFIQLIVDQINTISAGWQVGVVDASGDIKIDFVNETCLEALNKVATEFKFEFELVGQTINFKKVIGTPRDITFEYGRGLGLYSIERKQVDSKAVFTRVYGFGGTKNIAYDYRNRAKRLVFEERKLEKNTDIFGIREVNFTDDTIYPPRTATLTNTNIVFDSNDFDADNSWIEDTSLDFDINDFLLEGQSAKIVFKSGDLSGVEFEIWKADFILKRIYIKLFQDTDDYKLPSTAKQPRTGDSYTLVDMKMPASYIIQAELDLKNATQVYIDANSVPKTLYSVKIDPKFAKANNIIISAGDLVKVIDVTLGVNRSIRIQELKYPLVNRNKISAFIADFIPYELQDYVNKTTGKTKKQFQSISNQIQKITNVQKTTNNTTVVNNGASLNTVIINNRVFYYAKAFDNNVNLSILEINDIIYGNWFDRFTYVKAWRYKGGNINLRSSYIEAEGIDFTPFDGDGILPEILPPIEIIYINDRVFKIIKGWGNLNLQNLEIGDIIHSNFWEDKIYVRAWEYLGTDPKIRTNWIEHETTNTTLI